jgi:hypothetical protein
MRLFLDEIYDRRIKVLNFITASRKEVTISEIAKATGLAKRTVSIFVKQFEQELDVSDGTYTVHYIGQTIKSVSANNLDLNGVGSELLLQSTIYKIIKYLFLYDGIDVKKFCETEFLSPATFSRYRQKLKKILRKCGLDLSRENRIIGEELRIRNFLLLFFSNAANFWLFNEHEYKEMNAYFAKSFEDWEELSCSKQLKINLIVYISIIRSNQKNFVENKTLTRLSKKRMKEPKVKILYDYFSLKKNKSNEQVWSEISTAQFFFYKEQIFVEPLEQEIYEEFFSEENFSFVQYSKAFTCKMLTQFFGGLKEEYLYLSIRKEIDLFHLVLHTCFIDHSIFYYIYDEENFFYADQLETEIKEQVEAAISELRTTDYNDFYQNLPKYIDSTSFNDYTYLIIYTLLAQFKTVEFPSVKILVQNSKIFASTLLKDKISLLFGDRVICVENFSLDVDIIVTDISLVETTKDFEQIYVATFSDFSDFSSLVEAVQLKLFEKYEQRVMYYRENKLDNTIQSHKKFE